MPAIAPSDMTDMDKRALKFLKGLLEVWGGLAAMLIGIASFFISFPASIAMYCKLRPRQKRSDSFLLEFFIFLAIWIFFFAAWLPIAIVIMVLPWIIGPFYSVLFSSCFDRSEFDEPASEISFRTPFVKPGSGRRKLSGPEYKGQLERWLFFEFVGDENDPSQARQARVPVPVHYPEALNTPRRPPANLPPQEARTATNVRRNYSRRWAVGPNAEAVPPLGEFPPEEQPQAVGKANGGPRENNNKLLPETVTEEVIWVNPLRTRWLTAPNGEAIPPGGEIRSGIWRIKKEPLHWEMIHLCGITHAPPGIYENDGDDVTTVVNRTSREDEQRATVSEDANPGFIDMPYPVQPLMGN